MLEAIIVLTTVVILCTISIGVQLLRVVFRLDMIHDVLKKERAANANHRLAAPRDRLER